MAKSRRCAVRTKVSGVSPRNGRAMTRPTRIGCTISAAIAQTSSSRSSPKCASCAAICRTLSAEV